VKTCCDCKQEKPLEAFSKDKSNPDGLRYRCRGCASIKFKQDYYSRPDFWRAKSASWAKKNPEKKKLVQRNGDRKARYGLSAVDFERMLADQHGKCKICDMQMSPPNVDHCHSTGKIRGLLCTSCNSALGNFKDSPGLLQKAMLYLLDSLG